MQKKSKQLLTYFLIPLGLFLLNVFLILPLFKGGYTQFMGSIEAAYISDAKWIYENIRNLGWNPLWYMGYPFHLSYVPVLPFLIALLHSIFNYISISSFYRVITAGFYCFSPITLYFFVKYLTKRTLPALVSALMYTLPFLSFLIIPSLRDEMLNGIIPWKLMVLAKYGEGPHIVSLSLVPLAALFFLKALKKPTFKKHILVAFLSSVIFLINPIGVFSLILMLVVILFSEIVLDNPTQKLKEAFKILLLTMGLSAFWYNLSFLKMIFLFEKGGNLLQNLIGLFPFVIIIVPVLVMLISAIFSKKPKLQPVFIGLFWFLIFFIVVGSWVYFRKIYFPQPNRFIPELDMTASVLVGLVILYFLNILQKYGRIISIFLSVIIIGILVYLNFQYKENGWKISAPNSDIGQTPEYKISKWLSLNTQGERVYTTGSICFWLNVFSNVPQVRGGADGASASQWWTHATYQINTSEDAPKGEEEEITLNWLKALNVSYAVVNFPESKEVFHDYRNPYKFKEIKGLEEVYNQRGDVIYKIPLSNSSLAQIVDKREFDDLKPLYNAIDVGGLQKYVDYIENSTLDQGKISLIKKKNTEYEISADLKENEAIGLQISYNPGWKAYVDGKRVKIEKDVIDFMLIDPGKTGNVKIILKFGKTWDQYLGYLITVVTLFYLIYVPFKRKRQNEQTKK
ncbi:MAG: YfhO family protein [Candidatus Aenigmarchaeota archaeon]|nr:YfhO family protein [Candidatus Aenigmarchaeota archaeon]